MYFLLFYDFVPNIVDKRAPFREEHLTLARAAQARGELLLGGAYADKADGALLVFRAANAAVIEEFVRQDPYVKNGLVPSWRIRPWTVVTGTCHQP